MEIRCNYHGLIRDLSYHATGEWRTDVEHCSQPPTRYTSIAYQAGDFPGTAYVNLCDEHEVMTRTLTGWQWSRPRSAVT